MDRTLRANFDRWLAHPLSDPDLAGELRAIQSDEKTITDCFYRELEFGTGGLRGVIGAGTNRMNVHTVAKATQGFSNYLNHHFESPSVAIAYDSRIKSELFARTAAGVFAANGVRVFLYAELMPTPALSFAVRSHSCSGGIVITASHNPARYNGYKVYGADGCQLTTRAAKEIQAKIQTVDIFGDVKRTPFENAVADGWITFIGEKTVQAYLDAVSFQSLCGSEVIDRKLSIVYTPLNGAGLKCVINCLRQNGFTNLHVVAEQEKPDGNFPTCPYPNPEIREALSLGLRDAKRLGSDLLLATDPDCDRVGIAVKKGSEYNLLTGNEVGLLLFEYICKRRTALHRMPDRPIVVKTIVTTDLVKKIADDYGVEVIEVLTGFKFIGEQIGLLEQTQETERYLFGFEESYGYLSGAYVRDKDGVNGALLICEMAAYYKAQGKSLTMILEELYKRYGYCLNTLHSYEFEGAEGFQQMEKIMKAFRESGPEEISGKRVLAVSDYQESKRRCLGGTEECLYLPKSNVLKYELEGDCSVTVRPSGTEPKLKLYFSVQDVKEEHTRQIEESLVSEMERYLTRSNE